MPKRAAAHIYRSNSRKSPGVHSKTKSSKVKSSKHYLKKYKGQGRV